MSPVRPTTPAPSAPFPAFTGQRPLFPAALPSGVEEPPNGRDTAGWGVHRVMGTETEFGIHAPANPQAHHTVLSTALTAQMMEDWCEMMQIECVHITKDTKLADFKKELFYNDIAWKLKNL